ncbi:MAG: DUF1573 domain-containing protein [Bacteroidales bacterium]|nr:DUF1573 domain-containing protein [Bacteroidales bacterium]HNT92729.1 DUF1573 domain-containing protein [Bacteroidales bacterium]HOO67266.1 DUF1573 domain-containing protein [Bacteroidales bacterium]HPE23148.1 DUF1573 domain-containing protein [Bacteroidales bacterium]HPJ05864.1 DUF1573 domain-containing protein [Bacteroidales bacterium]
MNRRVIINLIAGLTLTVVLISSCGRTKAGAAGYQPSDTTGTAILTFKSPDHDFGQVNAGEKVGCIFTYTNSGDADLVITSASASCGCTVPKFDKKPVAPGGSGTIEVIFDTSGREGMQTKTVVVQSNAENNLVILRIIADIIKSGK